MLGTTLSADETPRKSSSLPAYARHGFNFGLFGRRKSGPEKSKQPTSSSSSSSLSSEEAEQGLLAPAPAPPDMGSWERTRKEERKPNTRPLSFETRVLVQETVFDSCAASKSSNKAPPVDTSLSRQSRKWKESGLSKKERREQLKARVEALRERLRDNSSSDEDTPTGSSTSSSNAGKGRLHKVSSDDALHRPRLPRTERLHSRRRGKDEEKSTRDGGSKGGSHNDIYASLTPTVPRRYIHASSLESSAAGKSVAGRRNWSLDRLNGTSHAKKENAGADSNHAHGPVTNGYHGGERRPASPYPATHPPPPVVKATPRAPTPPPRSPKMLSTFSCFDNGPHFVPPPPPPPPTRYARHHAPRPASYSFENTPVTYLNRQRELSSHRTREGSRDPNGGTAHFAHESAPPPARVYSYTDEAPKPRFPTAVSHSESHGTLVSSSHTGSSNDLRNFNASPRPWGSKKFSSVGERNGTFGRDSVSTPTSASDSRRQSMPPVPPRRCSLHLMPGNESKESQSSPQKSPNNLEDALQELEQIYQSLRLKDEGLMERAERRELLTSPLISSSANAKNIAPSSNSPSLTNGDKPSSTFATRKNDATSNLKSLNRMNVSGSYDSLVSDVYRRSRSFKPSDDLAFRRLQRPGTTTRPSAGSLMGSSTPTASYLLLNPALSPAVSSDDVTKTSGRNSSASSTTTVHQFLRPAHEADAVRDDVLFRSLRDANSRKRPETQPPFGIPVGPVTPASASDYLHVTNGGAQPKTRPTFQPRIFPDLLQDDMAYRALRKDRSPPPCRTSSNSSINSSCTNNPKPKSVNTEELDSLLKIDCKPPATGGAGKKKYRAMRSLSANITHLLMKRHNTNVQLPGDFMERTQSMSDLSQVLNSIVNDSDDSSNIAAVLDRSGSRATSASLASVNGNFNELSTSTETLTETPPCKTEGQGDIWQVRVTLHSSPGETQETPKTLSVSAGPIRTSTTTLPPTPTFASVTGCSPGGKSVFAPTSTTNVLNGQNGDVSSTENNKNRAFSGTQGIRSDDEAFPSWRRLSHETRQRPGHILRSAQRAKQSIGSAPAAPLKQLEQQQQQQQQQTQQNWHRGPALLGSMSDSDVLGRGDPMDEGRLDELLRSLAQGTSSLMSASSQEGLEDWGRNQDVPAMEGRKIFRSKQENVHQSVDVGIGSSNALNVTSNQASQKASVQRHLPEERSNNTPSSSRQDSQKDEFKFLRPDPHHLSSVTISNKDMDKTLENGKAERIAKYKEERRKQLASKYGDWSSSEDVSNLGEEPSYMRFSRRYRKAENNSSKEVASGSSDSKKAAECQENGSVSPGNSSSDNAEVYKKESETKDVLDHSPTFPSIQRVPDPGGTEFEKIVRTNRASRLRALATSSNLHENVSPSGEFIRTGSLRLRGSYSDADATFLRSHPTRRTISIPTSSVVDVNSSLGNKASLQSSPNSASSDVTTDASSLINGDEDKTQSNVPLPRIKDKSSKRKSNLNRAMIVEMPYQLRSDHNESLPRFHRTKPRLDNVGKLPQAVGHNVQTSETCGNSQVTSPTKNRQIKLENQEEHEVQTDRGILNKRLKATALKRPEIPEILRHRTIVSSVGNLNQNLVEGSHQVIAQEEISGVTNKEISNPSAFKVCIKVQGEDEPVAERIKELTELVKETTAKVDTLTHAALLSDLDMGAKIDKIVPSGNSNSTCSESHYTPAWESTNANKLDTGVTVSDASHNNSGTTKIEIANCSSHRNTSFLSSELDATKESATTVVKVKPCHSKVFRPDLKKLNEKLPLEMDSTKISGKSETQKLHCSVLAPATQLQSSNEMVTKPSYLATNQEKARVSEGQTDSDDDAYLTPATDVREHFDFDKHINSFEKSSGTQFDNLNKESLVIAVNGDKSGTRSAFDRDSSLNADINLPSILKRKSLESYEGINPLPLKNGLDGDSHADPSHVVRRFSSDDASKSFDSPRYKDGFDEAEHKFQIPISILRRKGSSEESEGKAHSILKHKNMMFEVDESILSPEPQSILKRRYSSDDPEGLFFERRPILKKKNSLEDLEPKPILKKKSSTEDELEERLKPILKTRRRSSGEDVDSSNSSGSEVLMIRRLSRSSREEENLDSDIKPILKGRMLQEDKPVSILKTSGEVYEPPGKPSILKARGMTSEDLFNLATKMQMECSENFNESFSTDLCDNFSTKACSSDKEPTESSPDSNVTVCPTLLPSILKKRSREIHPLATPHTEIANFIKAQTGSEIDIKKPVPIDIPLEGEDGLRLSVAERINQMEIRLEEDKFKCCRSPSWSGQSTPCQRIRLDSIPLLRSGECSPPQLPEQMDVFQQLQEPLSKAQLLLRLEDVAKNSRRAKRDRFSDRYRTQPVTLEEIEDTNSLASVQKFRRLVMTKASFDTFNQKEKEQEPRSPGDKKTEFPQPFSPVKSKEWTKHSRCSLPVTVEELAEPEKAELKSNSVREQSSSQEESSSSDDVIHLSVAAKASLFMQLEKKCASKKSAIFRRGLQRSQTQPVTFEELHEASKIADDANASPAQSKPSLQQMQHVIPLAKQSSVGMIPGLMPNQVNKIVLSDKTSSESEEDPCKLSLSERIKLFNRKMVEERLPSQKPSMSNVGINRRRKGDNSRYRTQPITSEELEKAHIMKGASSTASLTEKSEYDERCSENLVSTYTDIKVILEVPFLDECDSSSIQSHQTPECTAPTKEDQETFLHTYGCSSILNEGSESALQSPLRALNRDEMYYQSESMNSVVLSCYGGESNNSKSTDNQSCIEASGIPIDDDNLSRSRSSKDIRQIKNEAVNRRRNAALRKMEERRSAGELYELGGNDSDTPNTPAKGQPREARKMHAVHHRSNTTPLTKLELEEAEGNATEESRKSIAERVAALQQSGEGWKRRISQSKDSDQKDPQEESEETSTSTSTSSPVSSSSEEKQETPVKNGRPKSIVDRISRLAESQKGWKQRVEDKDATKFTVAGKMGCTEEELTLSPEKCKRTPKASIFRSKTADLRDLHLPVESRSLSVPSSATVKRSKSMPSTSKKMDSNLSESTEDESPVKVSVPKADDESFQAFFESASYSKAQSQRVEISDDGFREVTSETREFLLQKRSVKMQRRHASSRNPLKALATRTDIQNEYIEKKTGIAEKEFKRVKTEQIASRNTSLAVSALAGLASKEDFTNVSLKKSNSTVNTRLNPYKDLMLLQVKGRRHVQTRLVEPSITSINKGDNFILVTPKEVYNWIGEFSNVIERSRAAEVAGIIQFKKDLGCFSSSVTTVDTEKKTGLVQATKFYKLLGGTESQLKDAGNPKEDETYENDIINTNMVYEVENDKLVPSEEHWGNVPKFQMLDSKKVFVFDFGSEMYVWQGKLAPPELKKAGITLARELWEKGYDYSECHINPIHPLLNEKVPKAGENRPEWTLLAKLNQHMETILFKEKFLDWPDSSRVIKVKSQDSEEKRQANADLVPCDVEAMVTCIPAEPDLVLEGSHVGRGSSFWDTEEKKHYEIAMLGIKVWHVSEFDHHMLPRESWGQFHSHDTYVVRWQYRITVAGRNLAGQMSRHCLTGRERCAYFFWQGKNSTINEKGASALMTVELDEERGPHVLVEQDSEPPCFLNFFGGNMIIHRGKRQPEKGSSEENSNDDDEETDEDVKDNETSENINPWKLYVVRGEQENEVCLVEIVPCTAALRSRGCLILVNRTKCIIYIWHGAKTTPNTSEIAEVAAENLRSKRPLEVGFDRYNRIDIKDEKEGSESKEFIAGLGSGTLKDYYSLKDSILAFDFTPRLFHMSSISGTFSATEVVYPLFSSKLVCPFPFVQAYLYKAQQPALFMLDNHHEVYLWQGWWPEATDDNDNLATGSAKVRWNVDRRCAMKTTINYCKEKNQKTTPPAYLVSAGLEPLAFVNLFPEWEVRNDISILNSKDGKQPGEQPLVADALECISRTQYTLDELQKNPLPEGVDPSRLESYLDEEDFKVVLNMEKEDFYSLPAWKQSKLKKEVGFF